MKYCHLVASFLALGICSVLSAEPPAPPTPTSAPGATTYFVDIIKGSDSNPGTSDAPFKTTSKGIKVAQAGDTVTIVKVDAPIHEMVVIRNKSGEPGKPITIDGQNNTFTGCDPVKPQDWTEIKPGLFRNDHLIHGLVAGNKNNDATTRRFFMMWDGKQNRMGRSSKGIQAPLVPLDQLAPGQWTYVDSETAFYFAIDPTKKLTDYDIEPTVRENGVAVQGTCEHWVVRNINATHVYNDGFNIHGHTSDFTFENITAIECGDDGISEHEDCSITINGLISRRNSTGMAHSSKTSTTNTHVTLEDNYGYNLLLGGGTHTFTDSTISAAAPPDGHSGIFLRYDPPSETSSALTVKFTNCQIPFPSQPNPDHKTPFIVEGGVQLDISPDTKVGGEITRLPQKKPSSAISPTGT